MNGTVFIYALLDPETGKIRYVGKAKNLGNRLSRHLRDKTVNHRTSWIKNLASRGLQPAMELLDTVPVSEWQFWEREYIRVFRALGMNLVNSTDGGDGVSGEVLARLSQSMRGNKFGLGHRHTPEAREKIGLASSRRVRTTSTREKMSVKMRGNRNGVGPRSEDTKRKMRAAWVVRKGVKYAAI
jgi:hypothetical protein